MGQHCLKHSDPRRTTVTTTIVAVMHLIWAPNDEVRKSFSGFTHLLTMLYAVIQRFDSLREIETPITAEMCKLHHVGIDTVPRRCTLSDANARRPEKFFEEVYRGPVCRQQGPAFIGQPTKRHRKMDRGASYYRFNDHHTVFKRHFQGRWTSS